MYQWFARIDKNLRLDISSAHAPPELCRQLTSNRRQPSFENFLFAISTDHTHKITIGYHDGRAITPARYSSCIMIDRNKCATLEHAIMVGWIEGWALISGLAVKRGVSVELGLFNYIISYRRFQSRVSPSINVIIIHLPWFGKIHQPPAEGTHVYDASLTRSTVTSQNCCKMQCTQGQNSGTVQP